MKYTTAIFCLGWAIAAPARGTSPPPMIPQPVVSQPTTAPSAPQAAELSLLPDRFGVLLKRSIFAISGESAALATTQPAAAGAAGPPMPILRGVVLREGMYIATFENPVTHQCQSAKEGDELAGGRVMHLTLRGFQYVVGANKTEVAMGQNLRAEVVAPPAPAPAAPAVAKGPPGGPQHGPPGGPMRPGSPEAMQAAMKMQGGPPSDGDTPVADANAGKPADKRAEN